MTTVVRYGLLSRSTELTSAQFHDHWEHDHASLVSGLEGFRRYTTRYVQNHSLEGEGIDGVVATWQRERDDYSIGLYQHADYEVVSADERAFLDLERTVSVLGDWRVVVDGPRTGIKAILLLGAGEAVARHGAVRVECADLRTGTVSALGGRPASSGWHTIVELWFDSAGQLESARRTHEIDHPRGTFLAVREVVVA